MGKDERGEAECHCTHHRELEVALHNLRNTVQKLMELQNAVAILRNHIAHIMLFLDMDGDGFH